MKRALRAGKSYDLVMLDAYDHEYIPEHLLTREFLQEVKSLLKPGGIVAANTFSSSRLYDSESVTYRAVFGEFYNLKTATASSSPQRRAAVAGDAEQNSSALHQRLLPHGIQRRRSARAVLAAAGLESVRPRIDRPVLARQPAEQHALIFRRGPP